MKDNNDSWEKLGRIIAPDKGIWWLNTHIGASCAVHLKESKFQLYITGRDEENRSHIGRATIDLEDIHRSIQLESEPCFSPGLPGTFDENGVSYPSIIKHNNDLFMFYVGWMPTVLRPFQNNIGLAKLSKTEKTFKRVSRAPILPLTNEEPIGSGSCGVLIEEGVWKMWYTAWLKWGNNENEHKHYYLIRYSTSKDGKYWERNYLNCIDFLNKDEYAIGKPSVVKLNETYHMWFVYRGKQYKIGYAHSDDGLHWQRNDKLAGISLSQEGWESESISYPYVFLNESHLYMLYCGNNYGKGGLGIAKLRYYE